MKDRIKLKKDKLDWIEKGMFALCLLFYLFFAFFDGVILSVDSPTYIEMSITREALYLFFLKLFEGIFKEQYLFMIVVAQSILAAMAAFLLAKYLYREFKLPKILYLIFTLLPLLVSLMNRFVAGRASMYSNTILTEGITISLYLILFRYLLEYLYHKENKALIASIVITILLIATRKQMYVALALVILVSLFTSLKEQNRTIKNIGKQCFFVVCTSILIIASTWFIDRTCNYIVRGEFVTDEITSVMIKNLLYTSTPDIVEVLCNNFLSGLVTTVAIMHPILVWYSFVVFFVMVGLLLLQYMMFRKTKSKEQEQSIVFIGLILIGIVINVGLVSAVIFCQTRYTIYNMPLFYMGIILLLYKTIFHKKNEVQLGVGKEKGNRNG